MKKLYLILILGCSLMLSSGASAAESCHSISCASLGYSTSWDTLVDKLAIGTTMGYNLACKTYITCPIASQWDSPKPIACVTYRTFTDGSCPLGAQCVMRYKITSCQSGYTMNNDRTKCVADSDSDDGCLTEAEAIAGCTSYKTVSTGCYACCTTAEASTLACRVGSPTKDDSTTCAKSSCPTGAVCNSSNVVTGCEEGYTVSTDSNKCKTCTFNGYTSLDEACTKCEYKAHGVTGGYVCGITATSGFVKCKDGDPCFTKQEALWVCGTNLGVRVKGSNNSASTGTGSNIGAAADAATAAGTCYECCTSVTDTGCIKS